MQKRNYSESGFNDYLKINNLLNRYFGAIDDKILDLEVVKDTFTSDGKIIRPDGSVLQGHEVILENQNNSFSRFRATHHTISNLIADVENGTAEIRANIIAMHMWLNAQTDPYSLQTYFVAGGVLHGSAILTEESWLLKNLSNDIKWRTGTGLGNMVSFGKLKS